MDAKFVPRVFAHFSQGDAGTNRQRGWPGTGPVHRRADRRGSWRDDRGGQRELGRGSTFAVEPPPAEGEDISAPDTDASKGPLAPLGVVVVENDDASAVLATVLTDRGAGHARAQTRRMRRARGRGAPVA